MGLLERDKRLFGRLLGGAVGDALGAPVEFMALGEIRQRFGPGGAAHYSPAYGRVGAITDDTQRRLRLYLAGCPRVAGSGGGLVV
jgi:ADP-ribosylglycohydrolase